MAYNIFTDPRYVKNAIASAAREAPKTADSLDRLLTQQHTGRKIAEIGAGMGHLAVEMHKKNYLVAIEEPNRQSLDLLSERERQFYDSLHQRGLIFHEALWEFSRHLANQVRVGIFDAVYSNEGPLLAMRKNDGMHVVESYEAVNEGDKIIRGSSLDRVLECLRGLRVGIRPEGLLVLSVSPVPNGTWPFEYEGIPVDYDIKSDYDSKQGTVIRTRTLTEAGLKPESYPPQRKLVMTLDEFKELAREAGFPRHNFSEDGKWFWIK